MLDRFPGPDSLVLWMIRAYRIYLGSLTDEGESLRWARTWPDVEPRFASALRRIGRPVWFLDHMPSTPADDTPLVLVRLDRDSGSVRFTPATVEAAFRFPAADRYARDGSPLQV